MTVERGLYRHFKGLLYFVHGEALNVEGEGDPIPTVVYEPLYGDPGRRFVRSRANFTEHVVKPEHKYEGPRFARVDRVQVQGVGVKT